MKKLSYIAALILTACSAGDEPAPDSAQGNNIAFEASVASTTAATRSVLLDNNNIKGNAIGVYACYSAEGFADDVVPTPNLLINRKVACDVNSGKWDYSPKVYWADKDVTHTAFFAYAPYDRSINLNPENVTIKYELNNDPSKQIDLLWDATFGENIHQPVTFHFKHALASIEFSARACADRDLSGAARDVDQNTEVKIKKISLTGTDDNGIFYEKGLLNISATMRDFSTDQVGAGKADWLDRQGAQKFELNFDEKTVAGKAEQEATKLSDDATRLLIIPQTFDAANKMRITVTYTVRTLDTKLPGGYVEIENTVSSDITYNFQNGYKYELLLNLNLTSLKFDVTISDWEAEETTDINVSECEM